MFKSRSELASELVDAGLGRYADQIGEWAQPCLHFVDSAATGEPRTGATKLGGSPELPEGMSWAYRPALPHADAFRAWIRDDRLADCWGTPQPLTFFAQVDLSGAAAAYTGPWPLPSRGRLYFFWEWACGCFGHGAANARVIWDCTEVGRLVPLHHPGQGGPQRVVGDLPAVLPERHLDPVPAWSCPDQTTTKWLIPDDQLHELMSAKPFQDLYWRRIHAWSLLDDALVHRMLGWSTPIQDEPAIDAVAEAAGVQDVPVKWATRETITPHLASTLDWSLLLQVELADAYQDKGVEGMVYFMVPKEDAQAGRFDRATAVYQQT
jgi:hypothetical protein